MADASDESTNGTPEKSHRWEDWYDLFLETFRSLGIVKAACDAVRKGRTTVYRHRRENEAFATAWEEAEEDAADTLEAEARERATTGIVQPMIYRGEPVMIPGPDGTMVPLLERKVSDLLLIFLLKHRRPHVFNRKSSEPLPVRDAAKPDTRIIVEEDFLEEDPEEAVNGSGDAATSDVE